MRSQLRPALVALGMFTILTGLVYPLVVTGIAQVIFPGKANGSLIVQNGQPVGSALIGQPFDDPQYFWGRLSATSPVGYTAFHADKHTGSRLSQKPKRTVFRVLGNHLLYGTRAQAARQRPGVESNPG